MSTTRSAFASLRTRVSVVKPAIEVGRSFPPKRLKSLDGVRGLAILLVLACHFTLGMSGKTLPSRVLFKLASSGWCGVDLFFVLSGFLITGILYDIKGLPHGLRHFYCRRALRVFPLYYGVLAIVFALPPRMAEWIGGRNALDGAGAWLWCYGTNILAGLRGEWFPLSHFWSLAVEEHFYLFWPVLILGCDRKTSLRVCGLMVLIALATRIWLVSHGAAMAAYCLTVCRMDSLAMGGFVALIIRGTGRMGDILPHARKAVLAAAVALLALAGFRSGLSLFDPVVQGVGYTLLDLFFAGLLVLVICSPERGLVAATCRSMPLCWLGRYSYGLYVYNSIFLLVAENSRLLDRLVSWSGSTTLGRLVYWVFAWCATLAVSWLSWHLLEKHFLKLKDRFPMGATDGFGSQQGLSFRDPPPFHYTQQQTANPSRARIPTPVL
jgi:peptidoglycan/LPS O-acetylase OafA/YrhL